MQHQTFYYKQFVVKLRSIYVVFLTYSVNNELGVHYFGSALYLAIINNFLIPRDHGLDLGAHGPLGTTHAVLGIGPQVLASTLMNPTSTPSNCSVIWLYAPKHIHCVDNILHQNYLRLKMYDIQAQNLFLFIFVNFCYSKSGH